MRILFAALRAVLYMSGFVLFWGWLAFQVYDYNLGILLPAWLQPIGVAAMVAGGVAVILCAATFVVRGHGTPAPFDPPRRFVASGPYKYVRNPMYLGGVMVFSGAALYLRSLSILFLALAALLLVNLFVLFYEEPTLRRKFGVEYEQYCQSVRRWLPAVRRN